MNISHYRNLKKEVYSTCFMAQCIKCGVSEDRVRLYDAISMGGIVKICNECLVEEKLPIIKKPIDANVVESPRSQSVKERLTEMNKSKLVKKHEVTLRELIDKNFKARTNQPDLNLIDNFHWVIQRARRSRRIPRGEFARVVGVTEEKIKLVEQGILPENNYQIISKIEDYFGIKLRKNEIFEAPEIEEGVPKKFSLDEETTRKLKIADLRDMKKKHEVESGDEPIDSWEGEWEEIDIEDLDEY